MENPVKILHQEHKVILDALVTAAEVQKIQDNKKYRVLIHDLILFFRNYTEIFHHPKEEQILYPVLKNRAERINDRLMYEICDNHDDFKAMIADIENYFSNHDYALLRATFNTYLSEMAEHIKLEEKEILHISSGLLHEDEVKMINVEFKILDEKLGENEKASLEKIIPRINSQLAGVIQ